MRRVPVVLLLAILLFASEAFNGAHPVRAEAVGYRASQR